MLVIIVKIAIKTLTNNNNNSFKWQMHTGSSFDERQV